VPADSRKHAALDFLSLQAANISYHVYSGTNIVETNPQEILAICPIHNNVLLCDGSVQQFTKARLAAYMAESKQRQSPP